MRVQIIEIQKEQKFYNHLSFNQFHGTRLAEKINFCFDFLASWKRRRNLRTIPWNATGRENKWTSTELAKR